MVRIAVDDDRLVEGGQEHAQHQPGQDGQDLPVGEPAVAVARRQYPLGRIGGHRLVRKAGPVNQFGWAAAISRVSRSVIVAKVRHSSSVHSASMCW